MKIAVCTDAVYGKIPTNEAIAQVAALGGDAIEFWSWWNKDIASIRSASKKHKVDVVALCTRFISLVEPSLREEYLAGLEETIAAAKELGCHCIISQVGNDTNAASHEQQQSLVDGLKACVPLLEQSGMTLVIEPLNLTDHPGYYLTKADHAAEILEQVDSPNVKMLYDIYHQQRTEGNIIRSIEKHISKIGHFHLAGAPSRDEITHGELNYGEIFASIRQQGYTDYLGLEYTPQDIPAVGVKAALAMLHDVK